MKTLSPLIVAGLALLFVAGCGQKEETGKGAKPTLNLEGKTLDEQIAAVEADKTIPPNYKETEINALKAKAAATGGGGSTPAPK